MPEAGRSVSCARDELGSVRADPYHGVADPRALFGLDRLSYLEPAFLIVGPPLSDRAVPMGGDEHATVVARAEGHRLRARNGLEALGRKRKSRIVAQCKETVSEIRAAGADDAAAPWFESDRFGGRRQLVDRLEHGKRPSVPEADRPVGAGRRHGSGVGAECGSP